MVQRLETELQAKQVEADKLQVEKAHNQQRIKLLEHELNKARKVDTTGGEMTSVQRLQAEYDEMKITNAVYLEKIEELVEQINKDKDDAEKRIGDLEQMVEALQKQLKDHGISSDVKALISDTITVKTSISKTNYGLSDDVNVLRKEIDALKQKIVVLTDKNMEYQNILSDFKNRDRSRSKNAKK